MSETTIELTESIREVESHPVSLSWIENDKLQEADLLSAIKAVRGIMYGVGFSLLAIIAAVIFSGCTVSASTCSSRNDEPQDGGYEPIGWGMTQDIGLK